MNIKKYLPEWLRGWLPEEPNLIGDRLKSTRKPVIALFTATLMVVSSALVSSSTYLFGATSPKLYEVVPLQTHLPTLNVSELSSLQYYWNFTVGGETYGPFLVMEKNIGTSNFLMRQEELSTCDNVTVYAVYIEDWAQRIVWSNVTGQWIATPGDEEQMPTKIGIYDTAFLVDLCFKDATAYTGGGTWTYTWPDEPNGSGEIDRFYNIVWNPTLPDSLFQPPS